MVSLDMENTTNTSEQTKWIKFDPDEPDTFPKVEGEYNVFYKGQKVYDYWNGKKWAFITKGTTHYAEIISSTQINIMESKFRTAIEQYQCSGCIFGSDTSCFQAKANGGVGCGKHCAGTLFPGVGSLFLGMPKGFNRLGEFTKLKPNIYETYESSDWKYDMFNVAVWKYLSKEGNTFVRGIMPRRNEPFIHIFLENCLDKIDCLEITQTDVDGMD